MVDNCKTAVIKSRRNGDQAVLNENYAGFADYYNFSVNACTPRRPNEKGRIEKAIHYIKEAFLAGREPSTPAAINPALRVWLENTANVRTQRTTGRRPVDLFKEKEKAELKCLPTAPHPCAATLNVVANSCCRVTIADNRYSIPPQFASTRLVLHRYIDRIALSTTKGEYVANHNRSFARKDTIVDAEHIKQQKYFTNRTQENRHIATFLTLGRCAQQYLDGLKEKRRDYPNHIRKINTQIEIFGRDAVARALDDAHEHQAYAADYVFNLLHTRQRMNHSSASPLTLVRNADLLNLELSEPSLNVYDKENKS